MVDKPQWSRILLKLSGREFAGDGSFGIDYDTVEIVARDIKSVREGGVDVAIVVGGGNIVRGAAAANAGIDRGTGDYMGMLATVINALALQSQLEKIGCETRVQTAISMSEVAEPFIRRRAIRHLEKGRIVILAAGTGNPYFTTDTASALRALEINAQAIFKATNVDGVYDCDPRKFADAKRYDEVDYLEAINKNLGVMDLTAFTMCRDHQLPIVVFDVTKPGNIKRAVWGEPIGTIVRGKVD